MSDSPLYNITCGQDTAGKLQPFAKYTISLFISSQGDLAKTLLLLTLVLTGISKPIYRFICW